MVHDGHTGNRGHKLLLQTMLHTPLQEKHPFSPAAGTGRIAPARASAETDRAASSASLKRTLFGHRNRDRSSVGKLSYAAPSSPPSMQTLM